MTSLKKKIRILCPALIAVSVFWMGCKSVIEFGDLESPHDLVFTDLAERWDEGIPLGNGVLGALLWRKEGRLRMSLDRIDLWDLRVQEAMHGPNHTFAKLYSLWKNSRYEEARAFRDELRKYPFPTKIPGASLEFDLEHLGAVESVRLLIRPAVCEIRWTNGTVFQSYIQAEKDIGFFRFSGLNSEIIPHLIPPAYNEDQSEKGAADQARGSLVRLGYPPARIENTEQSCLYHQVTHDNNFYEVYAGWKELGTSGLQGFWTISSNTLLKREKPFDAGSIGDLLTGFDSFFDEHQRWWKSWWGKCTISVPDEVIQTQWDREMYKLGACTGRGKVPVSLQSVWTADNGQLPPWAGDFHHDLNTQLSYWPVYASNHLEAGRCFTDWLWEVLPEGQSYTQRFFQRKGLAFPGVTDIKGRAMGGWWQYSHNPTVAAWLGLHFYWQWRYSMDRDFLRNRAYPWIKAAAEFLMDFSVIDASGKRNLPLSSSPEINDDREDAWFPLATNFDLAFVRWTFHKAEEMARELGRESEARKWRACLDDWPSLALSADDRLLVAPGYALPYSHRHFSHLVAIHPLGLYDPAKGPGDAAVIKSCLAELDHLGTDLWVGYSFSWLANLRARAADGEGAAEALLIFAQAFCSPNTFHLNGDQSGSGHSRFTYRPFTLEGNFAWMSGLLEMLLQSQNDLIRILPAVPASWTDIAFSNLRAQGAFLISAEKVDGHLAFVQCLSEGGGILRLEIPFDLNSYEITGILPERISRGESVLTANMLPGQVMTLRPRPLSQN